MGCCSSTSSEAPLNPGSSSNESRLSKKSLSTNNKREDNLELVFKVKRANIFTEGIDLGRQAFVEKKIPKSPKQSKLIRKSIY